MAMFQFTSFQSDFIADQKQFVLETRPFIELLKNAGGQYLKPDTENDLNIFFILTGGTENKILDYVKNRNGAPFFILIAYPANNSLPAALETLAKLQQIGKNGEIVFIGSQNDTDFPGLLKTHILNLRAYDELKNTRVGLFGTPSDWLVASTPDFTTISETWGVKINSIPINALHTEMDAIRSERIE